MIRLTTMPPLTVEWAIVPSPVGKLVLGLTKKNEVCRLAFLQGHKAEEIIEVWYTAWPQTDFVRGAAAQNFSDSDVLLVGTDFQHKVWRAMAKIPAGCMATYGDIAKRIGNPQAARAVGAACGANPVPYLVPCHRVVAANGGLGGFSGGLAIKKLLLQREGCQLLSCEN